MTEFVFHTGRQQWGAIIEWLADYKVRVITPKREELTWDTEDLGPEVYGDQYGISAIFPPDLLE
jgi:effector-binding domain-containing protein